MFVIIFVRHNTMWYLVEAQTDGKAIWTKTWEYSQIFPTKVGAEQFKIDYLNDRNCAVISLEDY